MKKILLFIFTILFTLNSIAQTLEQNLLSKIDQLPQENIQLHVSNDFQISGEKLYYKIYCTTNKNEFSVFSKVGYVELINDKNESIVKQKISLNKGKGFGDFFIDSKIPSGAYKIIAYTKWMLNKPTIFEKNIVIINPFTEKIIPSSDDDIIPQHKNTHASFFNNLKEKYKKREQVSFSLSKETLDQFNGDFSVSVYEKHNLHFSNEQKTNFIQTTKNKFHIPELRGSLIKGKIYSEASKKISNIKLSLTIENDYSLPKTTITNSDGEFYFSVTNLNTKNIFISILNANANDYSIELLNNQRTPSTFQNFPEITLSQNTIEQIKNRSKYAQIENAYYTVKRDSILKQINTDPLLDRIKKVYNLDEYTRFNTVKETFIEVIEGAGFYKKKDAFFLNVTDSDASETLSYLPTLLIIDGKIVQNHTKFMNYNARSIKNISLVNDKYFYGNALYQGIVIVETFNKNYPHSDEEFQTFEVLAEQPNKLYFFQQHKKNHKRIPDFRTQLYWAPTISTDNKNIAFYTSDVSGTFIISINGYSKEGKFIQIHEEFTVE